MRISIILSMLLIASVANAKEENKNTIMITHTNSNMLNPTQIEYADILGKDALLNSSDVAESLLQIPGFSVAKKGGGGTEAFYRSQGGGRLPIIVSGGNLQGGCGGRMDTILTYVIPQNYNSIKVIKGPQDVRWGNIIAGGLIFDREILRADKNGFSAGIDGLYGSFSRVDFNTHAEAKSAYGSLQAIYSDYQSNDYKSGSGEIVHSQYYRRQGSAIATLTPNQNSAIEFSVDVGRGDAAYADRALDARTFDRESYSIRFQQLFNENTLDLRAYYHEIDHIMDNFSLSGGVPKTGTTYSVSNPTRINTGARAEFSWVSDAAKHYIGANYNQDRHKSRASGSRATKEEAESILNTPYKKNYTFGTFGIFSQNEFYTNLDSGVFIGARADRVITKKYATNEENREYAIGGFMRYEKYLSNLTLYSGVGYAERIPDFWEVNKLDGMELEKERNMQLDIGANYKGEKLNANISGFISYIKDYIMLDYTKAATRSFNTNANLLGLEAEASYEFLENTFFETSLSYTYGEDTKLNVPLAQTAPLQTRIALKYDNQRFFVKGEVYANARQTRTNAGYGNVVGKDFGDSSGFSILNFYTGYRYKNLQLLAGIENITDKLYSYHLSKNSIALNLDNPISNRIYEMGRNMWIRAKVEF
ncbi:MAG: TonB-dependent receptor [Helicobacteraceae bacterium]|nr:TonB-dependent receptor [Helicobacteraceae bacterium]